ncbi:MAG: PspC domain-containing protein [Candidatus Nomurabacteria bacterium]|jgi:phage shock protein PspC (stress-responsive transcriptional regulator)|nr:PspC domain-containing protein [Candidatus Nomurabacteria bacterium]
MNEIVRIHIAGVAYEIDVDAKKALDKYLAAIRASLGDEQDAMDDIEIRITEILAERGILKDGVVRPADILAMKGQLGSPKDFSSDEKRGEESEETVADRVREGFAQRKYFRDPENGILGGVLAGFAAYTGWDLTLLRVLFVILTVFTAGFPFVLLYIVVWICAPEAKTASDFLAMKGEPINLESIKDTAKDFAEKTEKGARVAGKKVKKTAPKAGNMFGRILLGFFGVIGLLTFIPTLIAIIPATVLAVFAITAAEIPAKGLFVATAILVAIIVLTIVSMGITLSIALIRAKMTKSAGVGLVSSIILTLALGFAASVTGGIWYGEVGRDGIRDTVESIGRDHVIEMEDGRVRVEVGPVKVDVHDQE